jgi:hypothetical protein
MSDAHKDAVDHLPRFLCCDHVACQRYGTCQIPNIGTDHADAVCNIVWKKLPTKVEKERTERALIKNINFIKNYSA